MACEVVYYPALSKCSSICSTHTHHTATHCNTLQHTATHCNTLQHTATHCNTLQEQRNSTSSTRCRNFCYHVTYFLANSCVSVQFLPPIGVRHCQQAGSVRRASREPHLSADPLQGAVQLIALSSICDFTPARVCLCVRLLPWVSLMKSKS